MTIKRPEQHRIAKEAQIIFEGILPSNNRINLLFSSTPQQDDYGIDGNIQVFKLEKITGEIYHIQLKGKKAIKINKKGAISFSLDVGHGEFLIKKFKAPCAFVLVDIINKIVYWHDIQTNKKTINALQKASKKKQKTFTFHLNSLKILPKTFPEMYKYLKQANTHISRKEVLNNLKNQSISKSFKDLKKYEDGALDIKGYKKIINKFDNNNAVMSIKGSDGELITYFPEDGIKEEDSIKFKLGLNFEDKEEAAKFNRVLKGLEDSVQISGKNIRHFEVGTKDKKIFNSKTDGKVDLLISQVKKYNKLIIYVPNLESEITLDTQIWKSHDGTVIIETYDISEDMIGISMKIKGEKIVFFKLYLRKKYIKDLSSFYENFNFIVKSKKSLTMFLLRNSIRIKIGDWQIKRDKKKEKVLNVILTVAEKLLFIQKVKNITFNFPPLKDLTKKDITDIDMVYNLLKFGKFSIGLSIGLKSDKKIKKSDGEIILEVNEPSFTILDETITFPDKKLNASGKPGGIEEISKDSFGIQKYLIIVPQATLTLEKNY